MDKACCFETSVNIYPSTRRRAPEELKLSCISLEILICVFNVDLYKQVSSAAYEIADQSVITQETSHNRAAAAE
jgi:hypothetical protein